MKKYLVSVVFGAAFLLSAAAYADTQNGPYNAPQMTHGQQAEKTVKLAAHRRTHRRVYSTYEDCAKKCESLKGQCRKHGKGYICQTKK